jgi:transcriptional regulator with XRE-family HTH domain
MIDKENIGKRIQEIRKRNKLNQIGFAKSLNLAQQTLSQVETGMIAPSLEFLQNLTEKYCISYEWVLHGIDRKYDENIIKEPIIANTKKDDKDIKIEFLEKEVILLREQLYMKDEIIKLMKQKEG